MKRRGKGEGSVRLRSDGRWEARITLDDGTRRAFYGKTRQEVATRLRDALRDKDKGVPIVGERLTVADFFEQWLPMVKQSIKQSTFERYELFVRVHILPTLGNKVLSRLTPVQIQALYMARLNAGASPTSVNHLHALLHLAFDSAVKLGLAQRNVTDYVTAPRMRRQEMHVLLPEQVRAFLTAAKGNEMEAFYVLALSSGMRLGELLSLHWRDVDLDNKHVQVKWTVKRLSTGFVFTEPKSAKSRRKIVLTNTAVDALRSHRQRQLAERLRSSAWEDNDLVFPNGVGKPWEVGNLKVRNFWPLLDKAHLPHIRIHDIRHTAATMLLLQGIHPKVVSEMIGHSTISITLDLYSHVLPDMQKEAADAMDRLLAAD
jgi:integrase